MKTIKYLTMAVAALMMAACSNEELDSAASKTGSRIALEIVPTVQGQTRANQLTISNLTEFKVSVTGTFCEDDGTEITNPVLTLSKTGDNWGYTYPVGADVHNGPLYWPREAVNATFSAYTHDAGDVDESTEHQTDIIGGWATKSFDGTTDPGAVALSMQHAVAKMQFKALVQGETTDAQKVKIDIKQVAVRNMGYAGTYAIPTSTDDNKGELTLSTTADPATTDIVAESASKGTFIGVGAAAATDLASFFMIPQDITAQDLSAANPWNNSYISVLAQVRVVQGGNETRIFPAGTNATDASYAWIALPMPTEFTGMVAHKKYIFTLNFSTDGIGKVDYDQQPDDTDTEPATNPEENIDPNDEGNDIVLPGKSGNRVVVTVEEVNDFDVEGNIDINTPPGDGKFSVSATQKVSFSKGNLQATWDGSSWTWAFAENQWDYIGNGGGNTMVTSSSPYISGAGTVDLFGWVGASNTTWTGAAQYGIILSAKQNSSEGYGNVADESLKSDWGNTMGGSWRTLTSDEWGYIFGINSGDKRPGSTVNGTDNARYTLATINTDDTGVNGVILFPDGVTIAAGEATSWGAINSNNDYGTKCTSAQWTALAAKGCVFLPAAGQRMGTTVTGAGSYGHYWSSSPYIDEVQGAYYLVFPYLYGEPVDFNQRQMGYSVRLVRNVE